MSTETASTHDAHAEHSHGGAALYARTLIALLFLTVVTIAASYVDFGSGNVVIALLIATMKATLVALFFMHLRYEKKVNAVIACAGFLFLGIFLTFCFIDVGARRDPNPLVPLPTSYAPPVGPGGPAAAAPAAAAPPAAAPAAAEKK